MSKHLDGSPQPVDPVWYRKHEQFRLRCRCGHAADVSIGPLATRLGLSQDTRLWQIVSRLRCSRCGAEPSHVTVVPGNRNR